MLDYCKKNTKHKLTLNKFGLYFRVAKSTQRKPRLLGLLYNYVSVASKLSDFFSDKEKLQKKILFQKITQAWLYDQSTG